MTEDPGAVLSLGDPWLLLDSARTHHLNGDHEVAWSILERIGGQSTGEQGFIEARRELSAYVLIGLEQYPAAFDSLQDLMLARDSVHEANLLQAEQGAALRIDSIQQQLDDRNNVLERTIVSYDRHRMELQLIIGIVTATLLGIIIFLLVDRKSKPVVASETAEAVIPPVAETSTTESHSSIERSAGSLGDACACFRDRATLGQEQHDRRSGPCSGTIALPACIDGARGKGITSRTTCRGGVQAIPQAQFTSDRKADQV